MKVTTRGVTALRFFSFCTTVRANLVIAMAGPDPKKRERLCRQVEEASMRRNQGFRFFVDVESRFTSREQWQNYLQELRKVRQDLYIRLVINGSHVEVREGQQAFKKPWHLFVEKLYRPGIPGELSQMGVACEHPAVTPTMVVDSTKQIASGTIDIDA